MSFLSVDHHVYIHPVENPNEISRFNLILSRLDQLKALGDRIMSKLDDLLSNLESQTSMIDGIGVLLADLKAQLVAQGLDSAKVDAAFSIAEANKAKLAENLLANTPQDPNP